MKSIKTLLLVLAIPALSASVYAGGCCGGGDASKDKKSEKEKTSITQTVSADSLCSGSCDGSKGKDKEKA
ncbi:hypothetical protein [Puniceicoccus vermicola]|uniref:Uncharacterized protein n=1 Tax=Puniceicoccus vermicola TaxID=388746 RepID=A0A7X1AVU7_9BACT|nr:hypothetical protein [Puniceicoccus vermicola]MBC2600782.1 hypothetical protein [Puniceicoccus vermicola]